MQFLALYDSAGTSPTGRARLLDGSVARGPFSFWRRVPADGPPSDTRLPFFSFPSAPAFTAALAYDLLLSPPPSDGLPDDADFVCTACDTTSPGPRHFVTCPHGSRCPSCVHDPLVRTLTALFEAAFGAGSVLAERDGTRLQITEFMAGPGARLQHRPDIVISGTHGPRSYTVIEVRTFDATAPTHLADHSTHEHRLRAHEALARAARGEYGPMPTGMRLVPFVVSIGGALGPDAMTFLSGIGHRLGASLPLPLLHEATWAVPRFAPYARMAVGCSVRRSVGSYHVRHWVERAAEDDDPPEIVGHVEGVRGRVGMVVGPSASQAGRAAPGVAIVVL